MGLVRRIEIVSLEAERHGQSRFFPAQSSDRTIVVEIPPFAVDDLFVHRRHTDQLQVVRGELVLVVLEGRRYVYFPLSAERPALVRIPPRVPHGGINPGSEPCVLVNALVTHGPPHPYDYRPLRRPFPYDLVAVGSGNGHAAHELRFTPEDG